VGLFSGRRPSQSDQAGARLPSDLIARLEPFGRFEYDPSGSGVDAVGLPNAEYELMQTAKADPDAFLQGLASEAIPIGGWTAYGAMRLAWHFGLLRAGTHHADADAIGLAALEFVRNSGAAWNRLNLDEKDLWNRVAARQW
jgi:hypothetical protein